MDAAEHAAPDAETIADASCPFEGGAAAPSVDPPRFTPRWAFEPWISKDISNTDDTYAFVRGFRERDIPVGVVVLDSPWENQYNTFVPSDEQYPRFASLVSDLRAMNIRTVLWVTQMVNTRSFDVEAGSLINYNGPSPNYAEGRRCGFYVNNGARYAWWKGEGSGVDFFNDRARAWWHAQQNLVLDLGIAGWKLDFGENYITTSNVETAAGTVTHQRYSEEYYRDYLAYGVQRRGREEFLTMVRPYDRSYQFEGRFFARREHAPVGWVGDNRRDWVGLADALDHIFRSARAGYVVLGSDIGGYLDRDDTNLTGPVIPFDSVNFARWTAASGFMPFFQLHGRANITPWTVPDRATEVVAVYRYWAKLHHELVPFFFSLAQETYAMRAQNIVRPVGDEASWAGDYRFQVGDAFLVAPILDSSGRRDVALPSGARWFDWWDPSAAAIAGGTTVNNYDATNLQRIPVFVREGAIVPMHVSDAATGLGTSASAGATTILATPPAVGSTATFALHKDSDGAIATLTVRSPAANQIELRVEQLTGTIIWHVRGSVAPTSVAVGAMAVPMVANRAAFDAAMEGWFVDAQRVLWVKTQSAGSRSVVIQH
jgi:alpha-glucosidase (family GH31 glycosyl hydrolase)